VEFLVMSALAFAAGVLSFTSPCCLPLMPGYVAYISSAEESSGEGPPGGVAVRAPHRTQALRSALLFVTGFGVVFTPLGAGASAMSGVLLENRLILTRVGGVVIILMGLVVTGILRIPALMREYRMDLSRIRPGPAGAFPLGMAFAIGWVPAADLRAGQQGFPHVPLWTPVGS
jgi:cytochrome c-type biogenesis protein